MQERKITSRTRPAVAHRDNVDFLLNTSSLHNYEHIQALLSERLRGSAYNLSAQHAQKIREEASDKLCDERQQCNEAQKALVLEKLMGASRPAGGDQLIRSMHDDGELLEAFAEVLDHGHPSSDSAEASVNDHLHVSTQNMDDPMDIDKDASMLIAQPVAL
jgi:hypothetical protein